jgi:CheY-like chemotaxis protein
MYEEISSWTILIADDDRDHCRIPELSLQYWGAAVYIASNGEEALRILETILPTLVLVDLSMPVLDGWATLERIRAREEAAYLPVIAITAHTMKGDREKVESAGFDGYIGKPFLLNELLTEMKRCIAATYTDPEPSHSTASLSG